MSIESIEKDAAHAWVDELIAERDQLRTALKAATWRRDRLEVALTALCSAAGGVVAEFADFGTDEIMELDELLYTVRRILQGMGEEMPGAGAASPADAADAAKETP